MYLFRKKKVNSKILFGIIMCIIIVYLYFNLPQYHDYNIFKDNSLYFNDAIIPELNNTIAAVYDDDRLIMKMPEESFIPRILHIQWKSSKLPEFASKNLKSWYKYHSNWTVMLWTDEDMEAFAKTKFSVNSFNLYKKLTTVIQKVDLFRYIIMYHFGGVYADIDISWESSFELLRTRHACIVCREPEAHSVSIGLDESVLASNFVLASRRGHPFWLHFLHEIFAKIEKNGNAQQTLEFAGPLGITRALETYHNRFRFVNRSNAVFLAPSIYFMPREKDNKGDEMHIGMLTKACDFPPDQMKRYSKFKQRMCNIVNTEGRIDYSDMYKHPRYFNLNGLQPFTKHHMFNSWNGPRLSEAISVELITIVGNYTTFTSLAKQPGIGKYYDLSSAFDRAKRILNDN